MQYTVSKCSIWVKDSILEYRSNSMQTGNNLLNLKHYRSRKRIRYLGEVFTPDKYVHEMLDMLDSSVWSDTNTIFFEPTCGHGNFVVAIVERRLNAFMAKYKKEKRAKLYSLANTLNNLWAVDVDSRNIDLCRKRVWTIAINFLFDCQVEAFNTKDFSKKDKDFLAHILCCLKWQIQENEALSCLWDDPEKAKKNADKTSVSRKWFSQRKHQAIDFELPWIEYFRTLKDNRIIPFEYIRSLNFLNSFTRRGSFRDFDFAKVKKYKG